MSGRHSSERPWRYYASVAAYFIPWVLAATILVGGVWFGVGAMGNDELQTQPPAPVEKSPTPQLTPTVSPEPAPSESPAREAEGRDDEKKGEADKDKKVELITENITIQVLNGTDDPDADDDMAGNLAELGYQVIAVDSASVAYSSTTVLWSYAESRTAAERLAQRFGWRVGSKPDNLATSVALHVVVGADEAD